MVKAVKSKEKVNRDDFVSWSNENEERIRDAVLYPSDEFHELILQLSDIVNTVAFRLYAEDRDISFDEAIELIDEWHIILADELFA